MARYHEVEVNCVAQTFRDSLHQKLHHCVILFCSVQLSLNPYSLLPKDILIKIVVEKTNYSVGSFSCVISFINDEVF